MSITILAMINPFVQSHLILPLQAHSWLEIQASFRLIPHWTRLGLDKAHFLEDNPSFSRIRP